MSNVVSRSSSRVDLSQAARVHRYRFEKMSGLIHSGYPHAKTSGVKVLEPIRVINANLKLQPSGHSLLKRRHRRRIRCECDSGRSVGLWRRCVALGVDQRLGLPQKVQIQVDRGSRCHSLRAVGITCNKDNGAGMQRIKVKVGESTLSQRRADNGRCTRCVINHWQHSAAPPISVINSGIRRTGKRIDRNRTVVCQRPDPLWPGHCDDVSCRSSRLRSLRQFTWRIDRHYGRIEDRVKVVLTPVRDRRTLCKCHRTANQQSHQYRPNFRSRPSFHRPTPVD